MPIARLHSTRLHVALKIVGIFASLYFFIVAIGAMAHAFNLFGREFAESVLETTSNPIVGLFLGVLATAIVQSSSTSTSIIVGMVAGGAISLEGAIPLIMGANIGTTVTSMLVSLGHFKRPHELQRAFAGAAVHCTFNVIGVLVLLPLEIATGLLSHASTLLADAFQDVGGMHLANPLRTATQPAIDALAWLVRDQPVVLLVVSIALTYGMLVAIVKLLRSLMLARLEQFFDTHLFRSAGRAMLLGLLITFAVQSSSIPTSLAIPLTAAGVLKLGQLYPFALGANLGTTLTAMLAALATASPVAVTVAFSHVLFNLLGIVLVWPIPAIRRIPLRVAERMGEWAMRQPFMPVAFLSLVYFIIPVTIVAIVEWMG